MTIPPARVPVHLGSRSYEVHIGEGLLEGLGDVTIAATGAASGARAFLVCDRNLPPTTVEGAEASLREAGLDPIRHPVTATEEAKSLSVLDSVLAAMASHRLERSHPVVALGGGITGDLAGLAAALYRRGVPVVQCPTTLLAMVDASVGGKTAVNLTAGGALQKNMAGAFHQPRAVVIDVNVLNSLPDRHFRAGLAECVKHAMIAGDWGDPLLGEWMSDHLDQVLTRRPEALVPLIARNVRLKAAVVEKDERETLDQGGRLLLNLGHTFAHAIETIPGLSPDGQTRHAPLLHGEAVALGLVAAAHAAEAAGLSPPGTAARTAGLLASCGLPTRIGGLPPADAILARMSGDKKVRAGAWRLVLPTGAACAAVFTDPPAATVRAGLGAIRA